MSPRPVSSDPVRRVLDRLTVMGKTIKHVNGQEMAQCPGHDDAPDGPSLAIREGDDGVILHCHAGCRTEDVVRAMSMEMRDLFNAKQSGPLTIAPPRDRPVFRGSTASSFANSSPEVGEGIVAPSAGGGKSGPPSSLTWVADYIYRLAEGTPAFKISRYAKLSEAGTPVGKTFHQFRRDPSGAGWTAGLNGARPPLYRLPEVLTAVAAGDSVLVVEGEKDADRAVAEGACATTSSGGAGKWRAEHTAALAGGNVIVVADDDTPGRAHATAVHAALSGVAKTVQVFLPAVGCKDLSEHLDAGNDLFALRPFPAAELGADPALVEPARRVVLTPGSQIRVRRVRWGWRDRMPVGELTLIPGREGTGKSLFLAWLTARLTLGELDGEFIGKPRAVFYAASEDSWEYTIGPRMRAAGADMDRVFKIDVEEIDLADARLSLPIDIDRVADAAIEQDAAALMLDPIVSLIDDRYSVNQPAELRRVLEPLRRGAERAGVMVCALAHFNKSTDVDTLSKIPGARAWAEVARAAFGIAEDHEADQERRYVASQIKNNLGRLNLPNLSYRIESVQVPSDDDAPADVGRLVWTGESDVGVDEVLSRRPERRGRDTSETTSTIVGFVTESGYPLPIADIYEQFPEIQRGTVRQVLRRAVDKGTLSSPLHGHYQLGTEGVTHAPLSP